MQFFRSRLNAYVLLQRNTTMLQRRRRIILFLAQVKNCIFTNKAYA